MKDVSFSTALEALKLGSKITRAGWKDYGMYVYMVGANSYPAQTEHARKQFGELVPYQAYMALVIEGAVAVWTPSTSDVLANDWEVINYTLTATEPVTTHERAMPKYKCTKEVWALKIESMVHSTEEGGFMTIQPTDKRYKAFAVSQEYVDKHNPQVGGYFVQYEDNYASYSPTKAFEEGYMLVEQ